MKYRNIIFFRQLAISIAVILIFLAFVWGLVDPTHYESTRSLLGWKKDLPTVAARETPSSLRTAHLESTEQVEITDKISHLIEAAHVSASKELVSFESTVRSCLGRHCMNEEFADTLAASEKKRVQRIGILAPERLSEWEGLLQSAQALFRDAKDSSASRLLFSTHVPAYGYGRNHGWTRIVRLVDSLPRQALRMVSGDASLFDTQVRQLTRWHCRLNHVAAHTAMLSVFVDDLIARPVPELNKILSFLGFKASPAQVQQLVSSADWQRLIERWTRASPILPIETQRVADEALADEMQSSDGLSKWPCRSFLELETSRQVLPHSRYFDLAADCSDPFVKCSVNFDKQEQRKIV